MAAFTADGARIGGVTGIRQTLTNQSINIQTARLKSLLRFDVANNPDGLASVMTNYAASTNSNLSITHAIEITKAYYEDNTPAEVTLSEDGNSITVTNRQNKILRVHFITDVPQPWYTLGSRYGGVGYYSLVAGRNCKAYGAQSFASGYNNEIGSGSTNSAILGGINNLIDADTRQGAILGGRENVVDASNAVVAGHHNWAIGANQFIIGNYNVPQGSKDAWYGTDNLFIAGNGAEGARSNALELKWNGNLQIAGTLTQSSDRRLKDHKQYLGKEADEFIRKLKPAHFMKGDINHVGFYAQDVKDADPYSAMTGEMNGFLTMSYTELIAPLVAYCQHLEERISELETKEA